MEKTGLVQRLLRTIRHNELRPEHQRQLPAYHNESDAE